MRRRLLSFSSAETLETVGLWLIILGLIGEASLIVLSISPDFPALLNQSLTTIFTLAIAVGVWTENVGSSEISNEKSARIAEANARAAGANWLALQAMQNLVKLSADIAPRRIDEQKFKSALTEQPTAKVKVLYLRDLPDGVSLSMYFAALLRECGWQVGKSSPIPEPQNPINGPLTLSVGGQPAGITLVAKKIPENSDSSVRAYGALLRAIGSSTGRATYGGYHHSVPEDEFWIVIGPDKTF